MDARKIEKEARRQGWTVSRAGRRNRWESPDGQIVHSAVSASDTHAVKNMLADLRRSGLAWPPQNKKPTGK